MEDILTLSIPAVVYLITVAGFIINTRNNTKNNRETITDLKAYNDKQDARFEKLEAEIRDKAGKLMIIGFKDEIKEELKFIREDIKELFKLHNESK